MNIAESKDDIQPFPNKEKMIWLYSAVTGREEEGSGIITDTYIVLFSPAPEVGSSCVAGDVKHSNSLETGKRDVLSITLQKPLHKK